MTDTEILDWIEKHGAVEPRLSWDGTVEWHLLMSRQQQMEPLRSVIQRIHAMQQEMRKQEPE